MRLIYRLILKIFFRVRVYGEENLGTSSEPCLIVANHISFLDGPLLFLFLRKKFTFLIDKRMSEKRRFSLFLSIIDYYPIDFASPYSIREVIHGLKQGKSYMIFPEGRMSVTGGFMKIQSGLGMIIDKTDVPILPVFLKGVEKTKLTYISHKVRSYRFPKIEIHVSPLQKFDRSKIKNIHSNHKRRQYFADSFYDVLSEAFFHANFRPVSIFRRFAEAAKEHGKGIKILQDVSGAEFTYKRILIGGFILGKKICSGSADKYVGVFLPNSGANLITFLGVLSQGKIPAMLNFTSGAAVLYRVCESTGIRRIVTSRTFVEKGELESEIKELSKVAEIIYLEDLKAEIGLLDKLGGVWKSWFAERFSPNPNPNDTATILFTSGSEGFPKGVALSHTNILSNITQAATRISHTNEDSVFNALPMFHCFGLTGGTLLPLILGIRTFLYPTPLHYKIIPNIIYENNHTIIFATDVFFAGYAQKAHPFEFYSLRYAVAGAEKLKESTARLWKDKFGIRLLQGYGATEASPVVAVNTPIYHKEGSVGKFLPCIEYKLEPVEGIEEGGRLFLKGPNILNHYIIEGKIHEIPEGWYDTGDLVRVDEDGYIFILDRMKRFAKIAGEMVSLQSVEDFLHDCRPNDRLCVVNLPDEKKSEKIVVLTENKEETRAKIIEAAQAKKVSNLMIPKDVYWVEEVPQTATGKIDYVAAKKLVAEKSPLLKPL